MRSKTQRQQALASYLEDRGAATSTEIQAAIKLSQATVSRLISSMPEHVVVLGRGRYTRYAVAQPIGSAAAVQPIWLIDESGHRHQLGTLSLLAKSQVHIETEGFEELLQSSLPWYLSPLRAQGFLGRLLARHLSAHGISANPESWDVTSILFAALHLTDAPGSILLGDGYHTPGHTAPALPLHGPDLGPALDAQSQDIARTLPAGSSAGGEQAKFLAVNEAGDHLIVKFSPPRGTPFGDRWHDLLHAEALCTEVLARHGHAVAGCQVVQSKARTYLLSKRFDRQGHLGRKHVVAIGAAHAGFVPVAYNNWAATGDALLRQGRLKAQDAKAVHFLLQFGRLIGNSDMHSGNLSLFAEGATLGAIATGRFSLAPVYDMLPMRWRPDPMMGALDYGPFQLDDQLLDPAVRQAAHEFWTTLAARPAVSTALKNVAAEMATRIAMA